MLNMKKVVISTMVVLMMSVIPVQAYDHTDITIEVDGKSVVMENPPVIKEGRTFAPLRVVFESLGLEVEWNSKDLSITGKAKGVDIWLQLNNPVAIVNGKEVILDVPAFVIEGRTYVPVRFLGESTGSNVEWDGEKKRVTIEKSDISKVIEETDYVHADEMRAAGFVVKEEGINNYVSYLYGKINNVAQSNVELQFCAERNRFHETATNQFYYISVYTAHKTVLEKRIPVVYNHILDENRGISREVYNDFLAVIDMYKDEFAYNQDRIANHGKYVDEFFKGLDVLATKKLEEYIVLDQLEKFNYDTTNEDILAPTLLEELRLSYYKEMKELAKLAMISDEEFVRIINERIEFIKLGLQDTLNKRVEIVLFEVEEIQRLEAENTISTLDYEIPNRTAVNSIQREFLIDRYCEAMKVLGFSEEEIEAKRLELSIVQGDKTN